MEMETTAILAQILYRPPPPGSTFAAWCIKKAPDAYGTGGFFPLFFLPILRIVYYKFYMGEEG